MIVSAKNVLNIYQNSFNKWIEKLFIELKNICPSGENICKEDNIT